MPKFTIDLPDKGVAALQALVAEYNGNTGGQLTVQDWLTLHVKELAISRQLAPTVDALRQQTEADAQAALNAAITTARDELIAALG